MMNLNSIEPVMANHLWQSTAFAAAVWLMALRARRNSAQLRYGLWLASSMKFLVPFTLLIDLGGRLPKPEHVAPAIYSTIDVVSQPFAEKAMSFVTFTAHVPNLRDRLAAQLPVALAAIWLCGVVTVLLVWFVRWRQVSVTLRTGVRVEDGREADLLRGLETRMGERRQIPLLLSQELMEPGIFGIFQPVLIWPVRLSERLEDQHIEAILVHELIHVRRRDNLTVALHMAVEALFWFHPIVWWIERRMVEERERACDEAVVEGGNDPKIYADSLLKACRFCVEAPLVCVGITGADLKERVVRIVTGGVIDKLRPTRKLSLLALGLAVIAVPIVLGQAKTAPVTAKPIEFDVVSIRENKSGTDMSLGKSVPDGISLENASLSQFIAHAYGVDHGMGTNYVSGLPHWAEVTRYDIQLKVAGEDVPEYRKLTGEQTRLMLQAVLADRFKLAAHMGTEKAQVYNLVVAKGGPKIHVSDPTDTYPNGMKMPDGSLHGAILVERGHIIGQQAALSSLLFMFTDFSGRPVIDQTGLAGKYDFNLQWTPDARPGDPEPTDSSRPGLFTALEEQLGLKLEPAKGFLPAVFIDHIEPPTMN